MNDFQSTNPYNLPMSAQKVIPQELGNDFLSSLNRSLDIQQQKAQEDLLGFQNSRGLLQSGDTNQKLIEQVLGPYNLQRQNALLGLAVPAAQLGEQQNFQTTFQQQDFQNRLATLQKQNELQKQLMFLQQQLQNSSPGAQQHGGLSGLFGGAVAQSGGQALGNIGQTGLEAGGSALAKYGPGALSSASSWLSSLLASAPTLAAVAPL